mgnify:CR=1
MRMMEVTRATLTGAPPGPESVEAALSLFFQIGGGASTGAKPRKHEIFLGVKS